MSEVNESIVANNESIVLSVPRIEDQIYNLEGIRIVMRLPSFVGSICHDGTGYDYESPLGDHMTLVHLFFRLQKVFGAPVDFVVVKGDGTVLQARTGEDRLTKTLASIRKTYVKAEA